MIPKTRPFAKTLTTLSAVALGLAICASPAFAERQGFMTPSGNILCYLDNSASELDLFCLIFDADWAYPVEDEVCDADRIRAVMLGQSWPAETMTLCTSDVFWPYPSATLGYGSTWSIEGFKCSVALSGVECADTTGTGRFHVARAAVTVE